MYCPCLYVIKIPKKNWAATGDYDFQLFNVDINNTADYAYFNDPENDPDI